MSQSSSPESSRAPGAADRGAATRSADVHHDPAAGRFSLPLGDGEAVAEYSRQGDSIVFTHTEVPSAHEGKGIGSQLARAAMDHARAEGLRIVPRCPFIGSWVKGHPEYHDLVHPDWKRHLEG